jgi:predicted transposase YdaD
MRESSTYQAILEEGREEGLERGREQGRVAEARRLLFRLGTQKLGAPNATITSTVESLDDLDVLEHLTTGILTVATWQELLATAPNR